MNSSKVLVFGGSFDPPHRGHLALLQAAVKKIRPEKILLVPAFQSPLKGMPQASPKARLDMVRLGLLNPLPLSVQRRCRLDAREARARRKVFTVETLGALKGDLHFLVGHDSAVSFERWKNPSRLKSLATWWYGARPGSKGAVPVHFHKVPGRFPDTSSTEIRSALFLGHDASKELSPSVLKYIRKHGLYGGKLLPRLRSTLSPIRYDHTLHVASLAESLARRWGADPDKARLAALLHDAGRRFNPAELARYARARRLKVPGKEKILAAEPMLLHAYASEDIARREFSVTDPEVLGAIRRHTLGDVKLGLLDKVVYVADACSADRAHPSAFGSRRLAFKNLDAALKTCVRDKLAHAKSRGAWIHPLTVKLWNSLKRR